MPRTARLLALLLIALGLLAAGSLLLLSETTAAYVHKVPEGGIDLEARCDPPVELLLGRHDTAEPGPFLPAEGGRACKRAAQRNLAIGLACLVGAGFAFRTRWRMLRQT